MEFFREEAMRFASARRNFKERYQCFSFAFMPGPDRDLESGGKIIMPAQALEILAQLSIQYPMLFKIKSNQGKESHCGVLEFVADPGMIYIPHWMMRNLLLNEGDTIELENVALPKCTFAKLQPQSEDFLDITNPKAVLDYELRKFACLSVGDIIAISYNSKKYEIEIKELKPANAVTIIECDMQVDFEAPPGYIEPDYKAEKAKAEKAKTAPMNIPGAPAFANVSPANSYSGISANPVFLGKGNRVDGKSRKDNIEDVAFSAESLKSAPHIVNGIAAAPFKFGKVHFQRGRPYKQYTSTTDENQVSNENVVPFSGEGQSLRKPKK